MLTGMSDIVWIYLYLNQIRKVIIQGRVMFLYVYKHHTYIYIHNRQIDYISTCVSPPKAFSIVSMTSWYWLFANLDDILPFLTISMLPSRNASIKCYYYSSCSLFIYSNYSCSSTAWSIALVISSASHNLQSTTCFLYAIHLF